MTLGAIRIAAWLAIVLAVVIVLLGGWVVGSELLLRIRPGYTALMPATGALFALLAIANLCCELWPARPARYVLAGCALAAASIALIGMAALYAPPLEGLDAMLWSARPGRQGDLMALASAACFLLAAIASLCRTQHGRRAACMLQLSATAGLLLSATAVTGYALDTAALYAVFPLTAMPLHVAVLFALMFAALLACRPEVGWVAVLAGKRVGSAGARRLLPLVLIAPVLLAILVLRAAEAGLIEANLPLALHATALTLVMAAAVLRNAAVQNASEARLLAANARLARLVEDKEMLVREVYHRVKNNLQQIDALLMLESRKLLNSPAAEPFEAMSNRIRALSLVHQLLLQTGSQAQLALDEFMRRLCAEISAGAGLAAQNIAMEVDAVQLDTRMDVANTVGLLVNELVANAIKHAFVGREHGTIKVQLSALGDDGYVLAVADDGVALKAFDFEDTTLGGTGSRIIRALTTQLKATLRVESGNGTLVSICIPRESLEGNEHARSENRDTR